MTLSHHAPACTKQFGEPVANEHFGYTDFFCDCHVNANPEILPNGNIAWPAGCTAEQALEWRRTHEMVPPKTWLAEVTMRGEVQLLTTDPVMKERANRSVTDRVETFVYWTGEEEATVVGAVIAQCQNGDTLRFTVRPEEPGAHAI